MPADVAEKITNPKAWVPVDEDDTTNGDANPDAGTTSGHRLATTVTIGGRSYGPDDHIPDDVADQIRNPKAWEGGQIPTAKRSAEGDEPKGGPEGDGSEPEGDAEPKAPARRGSRAR